MQYLYRCNANFIYTFEYFISVSFIDTVGSLDQGCTNPGNIVTVATIFFYGGASYYWVLNMELASCRGAYILRRLIGFWIIYVPLA